MSGLTGASSSGAARGLEYDPEAHVRGAGVGALSTPRGSRREVTIDPQDSTAKKVPKPKSQPKPKKSCWKRAACFLFDYDCTTFKIVLVVILTLCIIVPSFYHGGTFGYLSGGSGALLGSYSAWNVYSGDKDARLNAELKKIAGDLRAEVASFRRENEILKGQLNRFEELLDEQKAAIEQQIKTTDRQEKAVDRQERAVDRQEQITEEQEDQLKRTEQKLQEYADLTHTIMERQKQMYEKQIETFEAQAHGFITAFHDVARRVREGTDAQDAVNKTHADLVEEGRKALEQRKRLTERNEAIATQLEAIVSKLEDAKDTARPYVMKTLMYEQLLKLYEGILDRLKESNKPIYDQAVRQIKPNFTQIVGMALRASKKAQDTGKASSSASSSSRRHHGGKRASTSRSRR